MHGRHAAIKHINLPLSLGVCMYMCVFTFAADTDRNCVLWINYGGIGESLLALCTRYDIIITLHVFSFHHFRNVRTNTSRQLDSRNSMHDSTRINSD